MPNGPWTKFSEYTCVFFLDWYTFSLPAEVRNPSNGISFALRTSATRRVLRCRLVYYQHVAHSSVQLAAAALPPTILHPPLKDRTDRQRFGRWGDPCNMYLRPFKRTKHDLSCTAFHRCIVSCHNVILKLHKTFRKKNPEKSVRPPGLAEMHRWNPTVHKNMTEEHVFLPVPFIFKRTVVN